MGTLYTVATPIGNMEDITIRAIKTLFSVDIVACEDTRRTGLLMRDLLRRYGHVHAVASKCPPQLVRFDDHSEEGRTPEVLQMLAGGRNVALVSDAGTPLISDPGYRLVSEAIKRGIKVVPVPGPTAALAALMASGLPTNRFLFLGYPPEKQSHRKKLFRSLPKGTTAIFYCAPHKLRQTLTDMRDVFGDIGMVIARELTKAHEEIWRGSLYEALARSFKGELVLLLSL